MTQEQALEAFKDLRPHAADKLKVERERSIGYHHGHDNAYHLWDYSDSTIRLISSNRSWEHALAIAKSGDEDCWPKEDSPVEEEKAHA